MLPGGGARDPTSSSSLGSRSVHDIPGRSNIKSSSAGFPHCLALKNRFQGRGVVKGGSGGLSPPLKIMKEFGGQSSPFRN